MGGFFPAALHLSHVAAFYGFLKLRGGSARNKVWRRVFGEGRLRRAAWLIERVARKSFVLNERASPDRSITFPR
jgi:hypothetical protein